MKTTLTTLAMCTGLASLPVAALAQAPAMAPPMGATMMCRAAMTNEKPNAMMGSSGIVCKPMPKMDPKMGPDTTGMSQAAAYAAWRQWLRVQMQIPMFGGG